MPSCSSYSCEVQYALFRYSSGSERIPGWPNWNLQRKFQVFPRNKYTCAGHLKWDSLNLQNKLNFFELCNKHLHFFEVWNKHPVLFWPLRVWQQATSHQLLATVATEQEVLTLETPYGCGAWQSLRANKPEHIKRTRGRKCVHTYCKYGLDWTAIFAQGTNPDGIGNTSWDVIKQRPNKE